jgi:2-keto-4-pentenoate hydratase/2-oxohepta-3-ene-1,7-dioic acid hydratase in catechol pathway
VAVPASKLPSVLPIQTYVNGELRQQATTEDLIFSIPYLIQTLSEGQTLMAGDVLATGTVSISLFVKSRCFVHDIYGKTVFRLNSHGEFDPGNLKWFTY